MKNFEEENDPIDEIAGCQAFFIITGFIGFLIAIISLILILITYEKS